MRSAVAPDTNDDRGRTAVYSAEVAAFDGTSAERVDTFEVIVSVAESVMSAPWWPRGHIEIVRRRSDARSSVTCQEGSDDPTIRLAPKQFTKATIAHELAHVLAGVVHGHDRVFRRAHLDVVGHAVASYAAEWLADAYAAHRLDIGERHWPAPPKPSNAIAL